MRGAEEARRELADYLTAHGVPTLDAWTEKDRAPAGKAVAAVSLRSCAGGPPGFQDYLGERYNAGTGRWEELYGKRVKLTFGLDLWAATAGEARRGLEALTAALGEGCPGGCGAWAFPPGRRCGGPT